MRGMVFFLLLLACTLVQSGEAAGRRPSAAPATLRAITVPGRPGETCVILIGARNVPLVVRCTSGYVSG
jgi:hypothetical protein